METGKLIGSVELACTYSLEGKSFEADVPSGLTSATTPTPSFIETSDGTRHKVRNATIDLEKRKIKGELA